jgi:hypothetical protein
MCLTKHEAMKTYWGSGGIATLILDLDTRWRWEVSFTARQRAPGTHWIGHWVGPRAVLDAVVKRKIPSPRRESTSRTPIVQPVAQRYTDWAITALATFYKVFKNIYVAIPNSSYFTISRRQWPNISHIPVIYTTITLQPTDEY